MGGGGGGGRGGSGVDVQLKWGAKVVQAVQEAAEAALLEDVKATEHVGVEV